MTTALIGRLTQSMETDPDAIYTTEVERQFIQCLLSAGLDLRTIHPDWWIASDGDPFLSADYLRLTGRRRLWAVGAVGAEGIGLFVMLHPNAIDRVVFMASDWLTVDAQAVKRIASMATALGMGCSLARVPKQQRKWFEQNVVPHGFRLIHEQLLDWRFPVHTIDCELVIRSSGKSFQDVRTAMNKFRHRGSIKPVDLGDSAANDTLARIADEWVDNRTTNDRPSTEAFRPGFFESLRRLDPQSVRVKHLLLRVDGQPTGFAVVERGKVARLLAAQTVPGVKYMSDCLYFQVSDWCLKTGHRHLCLGGSETASLDRFKRKFCPIASTSLDSYVANDA